MNQFLFSGLIILQAFANPCLAASIKKELSAEVVVKNALAPEAITLSKDGQSMTFIAKTLQDFPQTPPTTAWVTHKAHGAWSEPKALPWRGMVTSVSFANQDRWLVATASYGTMDGYLKIFKNLFGDRESIGNLEGFKHRIEIYDAQNPSRKLFSLSPEDMDLEKPEMLKHARVSPDNQWLVFYTHGYESQRGIHLHNLLTKKNIYLGAFDDKHPTWTPDGTKILFHSQSGGDSFSRKGEPEQSQIGYYEIQQDENGEVNFQRVLMDSNPEGFIYQKHPMVYPGTDLLFFHGMEGPEKSKRIFVRKLQPDSKIYKLEDIMVDGAQLKSLKHVNCSWGGGGIFFVGHAKGTSTILEINQSSSPDYSQIQTLQNVKNIYWMPETMVKEILRKVDSH